jgi:hypothetical protein
MCAHPDSDDFTAKPGSDAPVAGRSAGEDGIDPRARTAWRTWLSALATDAEAAMAAALAYESLEDKARDAWLDVIEQDAPSLDVPKVALYAPLLAVEADEVRRARMAAAMDPAELSVPSPEEVRALRGVRQDGAHVCVLLSPVYLDFVEVLVCVYEPEHGFRSTRHEPLRHIEEVASDTGESVEGVTVEETPLRVVIEELAHAILAERRAGREPPAPLGRFVHLFGPDFEEGRDESVEPLSDSGRSP